MDVVQLEWETESRKTKAVFIVSYRGKQQRSQSVYILLGLFWVKPIIFFLLHFFLINTNTILLTHKNKLHVKEI